MRCRRSALWHFGHAQRAAWPRSLLGRRRRHEAHFVLQIQRRINNSATAQLLDFLLVLHELSQDLHLGVWLRQLDAVTIHSKLNHFGHTVELALVPFPVDDHLVTGATKGNHVIHVAEFHLASLVHIHQKSCPVYFNFSGWPIETDAHLNSPYFDTGIGTSEVHLTQLTVDEDLFQRPCGCDRPLDAEDLGHNRVEPDLAHELVVDVQLAGEGVDAAADFLVADLDARWRRVTPDIVHDAVNPKAAQWAVVHYLVAAAADDDGTLRVTDVVVAAVVDEDLLRLMVHVDSELDSLVH